ncbi:16S rRNA (guanine(966)-N(2))-methyltransferase RsmD [Candidatus Methylospira mobilis]|uniref:16S rRNA (guanine(966)-N(2))-methyltransferase RsmD n=1 Tax=Candidatus Methylospira mobilis TaxID=1808979 RepID=UPI0028E9B36C|nr:16S rRNA (guanine(966)-N(2))-methyltransferase RsmD [Candidatus Methylospira mobilis]WNV03645.1 16S rRNA (guanine(966)-N(2))-methyltransferase RsmD [Candidatus Methylospira mobilis]
MKNEQGVVASLPVNGRRGAHGFAEKNELRIIGGVWRSRKLLFPDAPGLRPTPGRVRETLFNWLGQDLSGSSCLDLFAGSGALGFEAASRGAKRVVMVEQAPAVCQALQRSIAVLQAADRVQIMQQPVLAYLETASPVFDIVFLDPPFRLSLAPPVCRALESAGRLAATARIYIESEREAKLNDLPENWEVLRQKQSGDVAYALFRRHSA